MKNRADSCTLDGGRMNWSCGLWIMGMLLVTGTESRYAGPHNGNAGNINTSVGNHEKLHAQHPGRRYGGSHQQGRRQDGALFGEAFAASHDSL